MSGIGAIFNFDGNHVEQPMLKSVAEVLKRRGHDGIRIVYEGNIGLVHCHFWTTPEEIGEDQPLSDGPLSLTADARIDNRQELLLLLKKHLVREVPSDAELILAAYREWGELCARYIVGDFAFIIWDENAHRLFCARDPVGIKPLHYSVIDETLVCGSDIGSIISTLGTPPKANIPFIADLLAGRYTRWIHETGFQDIFRLPPAHYLVADSHGLRMKRYYTFGSGREYHFKTDEEYSTCFRDLFRESVRARTRAISPVGLTVSGGLDSSSIACMAYHLKSSGEVDQPFRIYSSVYHHTASADERSYLDTVLSVCPDFPATLIPSDDFWGLREFSNDNGFPMEEPETEVIRSSMLAPLRKAQQDGCRVVISGYGGDQVLNTATYTTPYTLKDVGLFRISSELSYYRFYTPALWKIFGYSYISPLLPGTLKRLLRHIIHNPDDDGFLTPLCINVTAPPDLLPPPRLTTRSSRQTYSAVNDGLNSVYRATLDAYAVYTGIDWRYPFYDRRIIEFMLSIPPRLSFRNGYSRCILRQSMTGLLPEQVRMRLTKAHGGDLQDRGMLETEINRIRLLVNNSRAVRLGLVDPAKLTQAWELFWCQENVPARPLVRYLCAEAWLRHNEKSWIDRSDC